MSTVSFETRTKGLEKELAKYISVGYRLGFIDESLCLLKASVSSQLAIIAVCWGSSPYLIVFICILAL